MKKTTTEKSHGKNKGFTLIELLIVIAIIGVLAATVVISIGSQTNNASKGRTRLGVSSVRTLAFAKVAESSGFSGGTLCNKMYEEVSGEKGSWEWAKNRHCENGDLISTSGLTTASDRNSSGDAVPGEICCKSNGGTWVVWSALPDADGNGSTGEDIYCADSNGFVGSLAASSSIPKTNGSNAKCQ